MINDPVAFLANVVLVARADGKLSPGEQTQLEGICRELRLKKSDMNTAVRLAEDGSHKLSAASSFAASVANLEAMLRVAFADDQLGDAEQALVKGFCQMAGIYDDQLDRLREEVLASLRSTGRTCPACGYSCAEGTKFCPSCGVNLTEPTASVAVELQVPQTGIAVEFAESTAVAYPKALEVAKASPSFSSCLRGKKSWHLAAFPTDDVKAAVPLAEALGGIRNRRLYVNGQEQPWDDVFGFMWCASRRAAAYNATEYCFGKDEGRLNPWGCKCARMDWADWAQWFCYGKWERTGLLSQKAVWRFDKDRIRHELNTNVHHFRFCPHMNTALPSFVLKYLPDTVNPESNANWDYHRGFGETPGALKVTRREKNGDFVFTDEFWADGVRSKGLGVLADILAAAFKDAGVTPELARVLTK